MAGRRSRPATFQWSAWSAFPEDQITVGDDPAVTAMFLAKEAYDKHRSQSAAFSMERHGRLYDNTLFGLYYTAVGRDAEKNDFLENIK